MNSMFTVGQPVVVLSGGNTFKDGTVTKVLRVMRCPCNCTRWMYDCGDSSQTRKGLPYILTAVVCNYCLERHPADLAFQCTWFYEFELAPVISSEQEIDMAEALEQTEYA